MLLDLDSFIFMEVSGLYDIILFTLNNYLFGTFFLSVSWPKQRGSSRRIHHVQPAAANKNKA